MISETDVPPTNYEAAPPVRSRWGFLFSWTGLFVVSWVIYDLTAETTLSVAVFCSKFGWEDFKTSLWLRRRDPLKARGKMEFWIFVASGLWKVTLAAIIIMLIVITLVDAAKQPVKVQGQPPPAEFIEACVTAMIGVVLSCVATCRSLGLAVWHKQKIWLNGSLHIVRRHDEWPPPLSVGVNEAGTLMKVAVAILSIIPILTGIMAFAPMRPAAADQPNDAVFLAVFGWLIGVPIALFVAASYLKDKLLAAHSSECWPPSLAFQEVPQ